MTPPATSAAAAAGPIGESHPGSAVDPFDALPDPTLVVDDQWRIVRANPPARGLFDPATTAVDQPGGFWRALPDAAEPSRERLYRAATVAGAPAARFDQLVTRSGARYTARCRTLDGGRLLLVSLTDVTDLWRADTDLADREQRYRLMFERSPLPIFVYDAQTLRVTMANDAVAKQYGYARSELIGLPVMNLLAPEHVDRIGAMIGTFTPADNVRGFSVSHRCRDGTTMPVEVTSHGFIIAGRHMRAVQAVDVTDRDRAERELRNSEQKYRTLIETSDSIVLGLDLSYRISEWNVAAEGLTGYARAEVLGRDYQEMILPPEIRAAVAVECQRVLDGSVTRGFENDILARDGRRLTLLWNAHRTLDPLGRPTGLIAVGKDITDRKRAEDALRASEHLHRTLGNAMPQLMWTTSPDGRFEYVNARFTEFTGLTLADLARHGDGDAAWAAFVHPDDLSVLVDWWRQDRATAEAGQMEVRWCGGHQCTDDGHWFLVRLAPLTDPDGRVLRWVGTATDVDALKRADAELRRAKESAEQANAAKDQFLAVLSHELRTPLTPVLLTASSLQHDPALDPDTKEALDMIVEQVELEARLIDDLLDLTRISRGKFILTPQPADGHDLVRRALEVCRSTIDGANVDLTVDLSAARRDLVVDPNRIMQVLCNLLNNAAKFTPAGGRIAVRTRNEPPPEPAPRSSDGPDTSATATPGQFVVEVTDTGVGIDPEALPRIFNAFEQGERSITRRFGGLGLGLTIGRTIADMHHGSLAAASGGKDRGATLTLRLPLATAPVAAGDDGPVDPAPPDRKLRVLVVDDHVPTLRMMSRLVQSLGHDVRAADSPAAALDMARADCPDLLISDIGMPAQSGWSLLAEIQATCPRMPVAMAISGYGTDEDLRRSHAAGFARHLVKPIGLPELRAAIADLMG